jgi:hypothetical protein
MSMRECTNPDMKELLPDVLHESLAAASRAEVLAHVELCADCGAELELLRRVRASAAKPTISVSSIVAALPSYRIERVRGWRSAVEIHWRIAAAVAFLAVGVGVATYGMRGRDSASMISVARRGTVTNAMSSKTRANTASPSPAREMATTKSAGSGSASSQLAVDNLNDLTESELRTLLQAVAEMKAIPTTDPEEVVTPALGARKS